MQEIEMANPIAIEVRYDLFSELISRLFHLVRASRKIELEEIRYIC